VPLPIFRLPALTALLVAGLLATIACGSSPSTTAGTDNAPAAGAEANTSEGIPVPYTDSRFHYRIDGPGRMTANPDGTATYIGPSERLEISIVQGSGASNPSALASQDIKSLSTSAAAFQELTNPTKLTLSGHQVTRFAFTWNAGTSTAIVATPSTIAIATT